MMILRKKRLNDLLKELSMRSKVYVPTRTGDVGATALANASAATSLVSATATTGKKPTRFELYTADVDPALDLINTTMPPKDMLFPQTQKMYRYGVNSEGKAYIDVLHDSDEVVIFGIRSCDVRSIECMDDVFLTMGYNDEFYSRRRDKLTTVAIGCVQVAETCFCDSMGLDPNNAQSADIQLNLTADDLAYTVTAQTERGRKSLESWQAYLTEADTALAQVASSCTLKINSAGLKDKLDQMFEHPIWEELSKKCITCGTCTYVCPTCHCFDISQENKMKDGERFRCWDSCMFYEYTEMAGNHNPRPTKMPRVRQRFMHKLCFFEDRYGKSLCVGCGRCVEKCPVALDITMLIDDIQAIDLTRAQNEEEGATNVAG